MSSFRKSGASLSSGAIRPTPHSAQTLVSSGIPTFDVILNGGIPIGSLVVIEGDAFGEYNQLFLRYFLSDGVVSDQSMLLASLNCDVKALIADLAVPDQECAPTADANDAVNDVNCMKIAWRYRNSDVIGDTYLHCRSNRNDEVSARLLEKAVDANSVELWTGPERQDCCGDFLRDCRQFLTNHVTSEPVRIVIDEFGSPFWSTTPHQLLACCHLLRALARSFSAVVMVTVPSCAAPAQSSFWKRLRNTADLCVGLHSFRNTPMAGLPDYSEFHGMFRIYRLSSLCCLSARQPISAELAFKAKRKTVLIKPFHLPPDLSEIASRS